MTEAGFSEHALSDASDAIVAAIIDGNVARSCSAVAGIRHLEPLNTDKYPFPSPSGQPTVVEDAAASADMDVNGHDAHYPHFVREAAELYAETRAGHTYHELVAAANNDGPLDPLLTYDTRARIFQAYTAACQVGRYHIADEGHFVVRTHDGGVLYGKGHRQLVNSYLRHGNYMPTTKKDMLYPFDLATDTLTNPDANPPERLEEAIAYGRLAEACRLQAVILGITPFDLSDAPFGKAILASAGEEQALADRWVGHPNFGGNKAKLQACSDTGIDLASLQSESIAPDQEFGALTVFERYWRQLQRCRAQLAVRYLGHATVRVGSNEFIVRTGTGDFISGIGPADEVSPYLMRHGYQVRTIT